MSEPLCPNCDLTLRPVTARARSGYLLLLDQCAHCGGLWFDRWELFPLDASEATRLDPIDQSALWAPVADVKRDLRCPRCRKPLYRFRDRLLPLDARIERCKTCDGLWLNRGELRRFKAPRSTSARPKRLEDGPIRQLAMNYANQADWPTVSRLRDATNAPLESADDRAGLKSHLASAAGWIALRFLLRLLLRF